MNQQVLTSYMAFLNQKGKSSNQQEISQGLLDLANGVYNF